MQPSPLAGQPPPREMLVNVSRLVSAYYTGQPDISQPGQRVTFGTSGHRGSSLENSFNETHILAISQAICDYRQSAGISGPLFIGIDTHALSEPALASALEVFAANGVEVRLQTGLGYTPTPRNFPCHSHLQPEQPARAARRRRGDHPFAQSP